MDCTEASYEHRQPQRRCQSAQHWQIEKSREPRSRKRDRCGEERAYCKVEPEYGRLVHMVDILALQQRCRKASVHQRSRNGDKQCHRSHQTKLGWIQQARKHDSDYKLKSLTGKDFNATPERCGKCALLQHFGTSVLITLRCPAVAICSDTSFLPWCALLKCELKSFR